MSVPELPVEKCSAFPLSLRDLPGCIICTLRAKTGFDYTVEVKDGMPIILHDHEKDECGELLAEDPRVALWDSCPKTRAAFENGCVLVHEIRGGGYRVETPAPLDEVTLFTIDLESCLQGLFLYVIIKALRISEREVTFSIKAMEEQIPPSAERMKHVLRVADVREIGDVPIHAMVWNQQGEDEVLLRVPVRYFFRSPR